MAGSAAGSLAAEDLREIGIGAVAVDIVELALGAGLDRIERLGGLTRFLGWQGTVVAVAGWSADRPAATGRRARNLPQLLDEVGGVLHLVSPIDGTTVGVARAELAAWARRQGAEPAQSIDPDGASVVLWEGGDPPGGEFIVSALAQQEAGRGRFWDGIAWSEVASEAPGDGPILEGCACRACAVASRAYLAHLWRMREITAEHLLGWHNLHQSRLRVEAAAAGQEPDG